MFALAAGYCCTRCLYWLQWVKCNVDFLFDWLPM
jgi:hypothetical protein